MIRVKRKVIPPTVSCRWQTPPDESGRGVIELTTQRVGPTLYIVQRIPTDPTVAVQAVTFTNQSNGEKYHVARTVEGHWSCTCAAFTFQHEHLRHACKHCTAAAAIVWPKRELKYVEDTCI